MKRASSRAGESFSPPTVRRSAATVVDSVKGGPCAKTRMVNGSLVPSSPVLLPTDFWISTIARKYRGKTYQYRYSTYQPHSRWYFYTFVQGSYFHITSFVS